jgi:hypothetical protein
MCDMTFEIVESRFDEERQEWTLDCRADAKPSGTVGCRAIIPIAGWREQVDGEGEDAFHSFWGPVQLSSLGADSDRLIALIADYFDIPPQGNAKPGLLGSFLAKRNPSWTFVSEIECLAVGIQSDPARLSDDVIHMKLFMDDGQESGRYAEIFLNVDLPGGYLAVNEKDEEYRTDLVHWLSQQGPVNANPHEEHRRAA